MQRARVELRVVWETLKEVDGNNDLEIFEAQSALDALDEKIQYAIYVESLPLMKAKEE